MRIGTVLNIGGCLTRYSYLYVETTTTCTNRDNAFIFTRLAQFFNYLQGWLVGYRNLIETAFNNIYTPFYSVMTLYTYLTVREKGESTNSD